MKRYYLVAVLTVIISFCLGIQVSGNQSGTWSPNNNPYQVVGAITVPGAANLTILSGVEVHIMGSYQITVAGTLTANGTQADSIRFVNMQPNPTALWPGLRFENINQPSQLSHVYIEYGTYGIRCMNSPLTISHSRINRCEKGMELYAIGAATPNNVLVQNNIIENCIQNGILVTQNSAATITQNEIRYNGTGAQFRAAIQLANQSASGSCNPTITNNHIHHNLKQGISAWDVASAVAINPTITNNIIEYNYTGIYLLQASGYVADNQINHNFIPGDMNSGAGVMVSGITSEPYFERNHIEGNYTGFYITNNAKPILGDLSIYHAWAQGENVIVNNIDANGVLHSVFCDAYPNSAWVIKAENNDWGVFTADEIAIGINDNNDNPALPSVDFEPFLTPAMPTAIIGSYVYNGQLIVNNARLELISVENGSVLSIIPLTTTQINVSAVLLENFYAQVVLNINPQLSLYGCAGGYINPTEFSPGDLVPVEIGQIEVTEVPPPRYQLIGESYQGTSLVFYPIMHGMGVYGWRSLDWVYANGDYLFITQTIRRTPEGEMVTDLPPGTDYRKFLNISAGDTWIENEVSHETGEVRTSFARADQCGTYLDIQSYLMITRTDSLGVVIDKKLIDSQQDMLFHYNNYWTVGRESLLRFGDPEPLAEGSITLFMPEPLDTKPNYLGFDPDTYNEETQQHQVHLYWQAPAFAANNWTHYRIYRNYEVIAEIPFSQTDYLDLTWLADCTTYYEITAWDGSTESEPSNWVLVLIVGNSDEFVQPVSVNIYPNPVGVSRGENLSIDLSNIKNRSAELEIFNLKGQKVHSAKVIGAEQYLWTGRDTKGIRCASGIYFIRVNIKGEKPFTHKLVLQ